jgi:hypothetical protein
VDQHLVTRFQAVEQVQQVALGGRRGVALLEHHVAACALDQTTLDVRRREIRRDSDDAITHPAKAPPRPDFVDRIMRGECDDSMKPRAACGTNA